MVLCRVKVKYHQLLNYQNKLLLHLLLPYIARRCEDCKMLLGKIKLLMCDSKVLLDIYILQMCLPIEMCMYFIYVIIPLCGEDCDCDPCDNYNSFLKEKYVIC